MALVVATTVFVVLNRLPGDSATVIAGLDSDARTVAIIRTQLGLDQPVAVRYFRWLSSAFRGDFGTSLVTRAPVLRMIAERLPLTLSLAVVAFVVAVVGATILVALSAFGSVGRAVAQIAEYVALAFPQFWIAILLVYLFGFRLRLLPIFGADSWRSFVLPAAALAIGNAAVLSRAARNALVEERFLNHIAAAAAFGVPRRRIFWFHLLPAAALPAVSVAAVQLGYLLGGAIIVEQVFGLPGLGQLAVEAILTRDVPLVQGVVLVFAVIFPLAGALSDLVVGLLDPRVRA